MDRMVLANADDLARLIREEVRRATEEALARAAAARSDDDVWWGIEEIAEWLSVSPTTVRREVVKPGFPAGRTLGIGQRRQVAGRRWGRTCYGRRWGRTCYR